MIVRQNGIDPKVNVIKLVMCFSKVDVLKWLRRYSSLACVYSSDAGREWLSTPLSEYEVRHWLEHDCMALGVFEERWSRQLSAWAWNVALREKYFEQSSTPGKENEYYPTKILLKRVGHPKNKEE